MMDAVEYLKEKKRMLYSYMDGDTPTSEVVRVISEMAKVESENPEEAVRIVEEWSKAHPIQTNGQKFVEVFGFEPTTWTKMGEDIHDFIIDPHWWHGPYEAPKGADK